MATFDKVIKGGMVIDGQMVPRRRADVAIKDGRIAKIGRVSSSDAAEVLDASGLIVAPGFVDLHTHYDCAFFYDPWCSLSGWHGATAEERAEMCRLLKEAMDAGACGWSAQRTAPGSGYDVQRDHDGTPFATDLMSNETAVALARVLADYDHAFIQTLIAQQGDRTGTDPKSADNAKNAVRQHLEALARVSDSAIILTAITTDTRTPNNH